MLKVKLLHPDAKAPTVSYAGSDIGFDLYALEGVVLEPGVVAKVRTGIAVEGPPGYGFVLGDRSSMAARGVTYLGGRIDAGYRGEILVCLMNVNQPKVSLAVERDRNGHVTGATLLTSDVSIAIKKGDRIIQMSLFRADTDRQIQVVDVLSQSARDTQGFGSTGR
jgi:dUTP pyrophosphatase